MTDIEKKALEAYPIHPSPGEAQIIIKKGEDTHIDLRKGYTQALIEYESLPKIRGWVAVNRYGCSPRTYFYPTKPKRQDGYWTEGRNVTNLAVPNWNGKFEDEPVEVELLIRKVI